MTRNNLWVSLFLGFLACGGSGGPTGMPTDPKEITVYTFGQPQMKTRIDMEASAFQQRTGVKVNVVGELDFSQLQPTIESKAKAGSTDWDVYMSGNAWVADYVNLGYAQPLDTFIAADSASAELDYADIPDGVRKKNSFGGKTYSMLVDNDNMIFFYRKDVLGDPAWQEQYRNAPENVTHKELPNPPQTLAEMFDVAMFFRDKDWNPEVSGETSFVTSSAGLGQSHYYLLAWTTPYTVMPPAVAPQAGLLLFKPDMTPLVNSPGFVRGVTEWKQMVDCCTKSFGADDGPNGLLRREAVIDQFIRGRALMAIDWGDIGPAAFRPESTVRGKVGFAMAPGAMQYYDWQTSTWSTTTTPNFAPMHQFNGWALYLPTTSKKKDLGWQFVRHFCSPQKSLETVADPSGGYQPWRTSHSTNLAYWESQGWGSSDARSYVQAILDTTNHPNRVIDIRIPGSFRYGDVLEAELKNVVSGSKTPQQAMDDAATAFEEITTDLGRAPSIEAYRSHLE
jgi:multiple sugar transport system substrate-binding protein